jgi:adenosylhomocysteine nucleosidase
MSLPDVCLVFALQRESGYLPRGQRVAAPCAAWLQGGALVLETGVGPVAVARALAWLSGRPSPRLVVSAGFAGALSPTLTVGDLVLADAVIGPDGAVWPACAGGLRALRGLVLTSAVLIGDPAEKRRLAEAHRAAVVDMEAAHVARWCAARGVAFACLKAVSDAAATALPADLLGVLDGGRVRPWRLAAALARRPRLIGDLWRLGRDTRAAALALAGGLTPLLTPALPPPPAAAAAP